MEERADPRLRLQTNTAPHDGEKDLHGWVWRAGGAQRTGWREGTGHLGLACFCTTTGAFTWGNLHTNDNAGTQGAGL